MAVRQPVQPINYGGGHTQYIRNGDAKAAAQWVVHWDALPADDATKLLDFLEAQAGVKPFVWTPPLGTSSATFICMEWTVTPLHSGHQNINAVFIQRPD